MTTERCIDGSPHKFVLNTAKEVREVGYRNWKTFDIYFCEKCLKYEEVELPKKEEIRRW